ncbi:DUF2950 domain-containing protein [Oxalicibacterium solurbis]|uniref:DUF2950 domain-containing protein n=1 Tax=Oxalicibacterium solurbis TaxID=69280 RepID=A0A8J3F4T7_9BURK|nr:DUF2950 domain-containing protein [Oxalicibacterium solurbis]GGI52843.1 hypothetical protein GCM10011430_00170 [Oxalicibacterium solurbis]
MRIDTTIQKAALRHDRFQPFTALLMTAGVLLMLMAFPAGAQQTYPSAETAADTFTETIMSNDMDRLQTVLGKDWKRFVPTQDIDRDDINVFLAAWAESHRIVEEKPGKAWLQVGEEGWTLPIPIVRHGNGWQFDPKAGRDEMRTRRIGRNELNAMQSVLAYYDAQKEYASVPRTPDGVLQYAQKFRSTPGKHDGLYWPASGDEQPSPLGALFDARTQGEGYHGYRYRILAAQGKDAPGGAYGYMIQGRMVSGFALVAWPVRYGETGVKSFIISHDAQLYEQDLGPDTAAVASRMRLFDPDAGWSKVTPAKPDGSSGQQGQGN